ncbi:hypothetical protein KBY55_09690 [Streptomyces sp. b94]|uniref:hypothetical protein n=1 Tax=Streptomyces sp. b94 TaxID=1827634 RepID=UPI001B37B402|nr:hypothetical protein [Streptomyces sp. b94]MBQ1096356.1 hypothetical protein [Streptomyces sp. b94]
MSELDRPSPQESLTPDDFEAYRRIAETQQPPAGYDVTRLVAMRLIDPDPYTAGRYIPHDPRAAAQSITTAALHSLSTIVHQLSQVPALERLADDFDPHRLYGGPGSEFLPSAAQMNARVGEVCTAAADEICSIQPSEPADRDPTILRLGVERTRSALLRGVQVQSLYHRSAHDHAQTRSYVAAMMADGAEVRASSTPGPRLVMVDRQHLFIDNHVIEGAEGNSGWHVFDRAAVAWVRSLFDLFWNTAVRWQDIGDNASPLSERQWRILRELAAGYTQEQVGPRIKLSRRAVDKEIAFARDALSFRTTFQLMAWYGRAQGERQAHG